MLDKKVSYFILVAQKGSFSAAARELLLSQSALSQQITLLEREIGIKLFDRSGYRPVLTPAGKKYYTLCLSLKENYTKKLSEIRKDNTKTISIGFSGSFENKEVMELINNFKKIHPNISFSFFENSFDGVIKLLQNNEVDIAFGLESEMRGLPNVDYEVLYPYEICMICSHTHTLSSEKSIKIENLEKEDFVVLSKKFSKRFYNSFLDACTADGFIPKIKKEVDSFDELIFNVSIGEGVAIVAKNVVRENEVKIVPIYQTHHKNNYVVGFLHDKNNFELNEFIAATVNFFKHYK